MSDTVTSERFADAARDELRREIVTPEGVPLVFTVARAGDRAAAFLTDFMILVACLAVVILLWALMIPAGAGAGVAALVMLAVFLLRHGYFIWFEMRWQGRTPGKRFVGLRVIDARGRPLGADAIFVRNLTREVELFLPLVALSSPDQVMTAGPGWVRALSVLWLGIFLVLPLLNKERRRIGDLLAGTLVVRDHVASLDRELAAAGPTGAAAPAGPRFSAEQLAMYGVYELQVLEQVLREAPDASPNVTAVAAKVKRKIGWTGDEPSQDPRRFLEAFYRAQRARLERDLLLGQARERKRQGRLGTNRKRERA